jgi:hypothetical protein
VRDFPAHVVAAPPSQRVAGVEHGVRVGDDSIRVFIEDDDV